MPDTDFTWAESDFTVTKLYVSSSDDLNMYFTHPPGRPTQATVDAIRRIGFEIGGKTYRLSDLFNSFVVVGAGATRQLGFQADTESPIPIQSGVPFTLSLADPTGG